MQVGFPAVARQGRQIQRDHPRRQAGFQQLAEQGEQGRKDGGRRFVDIGRNGADVMLKGKRQQRTGKPCQLPPDQFGVDSRVAQEIAQHRLGGIQRVKQPEQGDIGDGKVRHTLVAFPAHRHQTLALRP